MPLGEIGSQMMIFMFKANVKTNGEFSFLRGNGQTTNPSSRTDLADAGTAGKLTSQIKTDFYALKAFLDFRSHVSQLKC